MNKKKYTVVEIKPQGKQIEVNSIEEVAEVVMSLIGKPEENNEPDNRIPLREGWKDVYDY